ncbi:uncharacterized protein K02A2.6-like [Wyeomyia smithii]|uniref:uncharacterized protein K02A2.6-like n=1 Tax=Wyeomyia smithii TaxID=174621 RepID=UPI002467DFE0|nr:uncharacterized protein K02A2.6-like [Wyeomyia smithii]
MKGLARAYVWWPGLDKDVEEKARECQYCLQEQPSPALSKLVPWPVPEPNFTIERTMECIARFGLVDTVVSDNGTQFTAGKFQSFLMANGIRHCPTAPGHPATNGAAENFVKTFKASLKKTLLEKRSKNPYEVWVWEYRKTPHCSSKISPAAAMLGRELITNFDRLIPCKSQVSDSAALRKNLQRAQAKQRVYHKGIRSNSFQRGDNVLVRDYTDPNHAGRKQ